MILEQRIKLLQTAMDTYTKADMEKQLRPMAVSFLKKHASLVESEHMDLATYVAIGEKKSMTKAELTKLVTLPFVTKNLYEKWQNLLTKSARDIWDTLVFEKQLHESEIRDRFDADLTIKKDRYWYGQLMDRISPDYRLFLTQKAGSWNHVTVSVQLPFELRVLLKDFYTPPASAEIVILSECPPTEFRYENGDRTILSEISRILLYHEQEQIPVTGKDRPKFTSLGRMKKTLNLREFFEEDEKDKKLRILRTNILASLIVFGGKKTEESWLLYLRKNILGRSLLNYCDTAATLLNDLKGMGHVDSHYLTGIEPYYFDFLKTLASNIDPELSGGWLDFEALYQSARFNLLPMEPIMSWLAADKLYFDYEDMVEEGEYKYKETRHWIKEQRYHEAIGIPYFKATIFMYAALGILDIAYDRPDRTVVGKTCNSCYDGLRYLRFTSFGRYMLGLTDQYDIEDLIEDKSITFSPDALTITTGSTDPAMDFTLKPYTRQLGPNRYATDSQTFLQGIHSRGDLSKKVKMFREVTNTEFPPNWETFFDDLGKKVDPFEPLKEQMVIYKLPENNRPLIQLIAQDAVLKKIVLKAEGYHIIFPKSKMLVFKKRLAEFGYLVT